MKPRHLWRATGFVCAPLLLASAAMAQLSGHNTKGDFGLQAGSQPPAGIYVVPMYLNYSADTFRDANGGSFSSIDSGGSIDVRATVAGFMWVTEKQFLGGNYSLSAWPSLINNALEFPPAGIDEEVGTGFSDLYIQPINLGWHRDRADYVAGLGIFAPTGEYRANGDSNNGLGMWSYELFGGTTVYLNEAKTWHFAALASYEAHGKKEDSDVRVGDILTLAHNFFGKATVRPVVIDCGFGRYESKIITAKRAIVFTGLPQVQFRSE